MTRVHDMGGRFGDGPVIPDPEGEVFHDDWHGRALALTLAAGALGQWNLDISRHARERLGPDYNRFSYYEKWIAATADLLVENGVLDASELTRWRPASWLPRPCLQPCRVAGRWIVTLGQSRSFSRGRRCWCAAPPTASWSKAGTRGCRPMPLARGARFCVATEITSFPMPMPTVWAKRPSRCTRWPSRPRNSGHIPNIPATRW